MLLNFKRRSVLFLFHEEPSSKLVSTIEKYRPTSWKYYYSTTLDECSKKHEFIVPWNYRRVIKTSGFTNRIIVFHASDLPNGRGWAPIANTILTEIEYYTLTGFFATDIVDAGPIILKAKFRMEDWYTASILRRIDNELMAYLTALILQKSLDGDLETLKQNDSSATYIKRRQPSAGELKISEDLGSCFTRLRIAEEVHPCFFLYKGTTYEIRINPVISFPVLIPIEILFSKSNKHEETILELSEDAIEILTQTKNPT